MYACGGQRITSDIILQKQPTLFSETASRTDLELSKYTKVAPQEIPGVCMYLPLLCWDYKDMPHHALVFLHGF